MTPRNPLQNLIAQLCPQGVEFRKLGDVCKSLPKGTLKTTRLKNEGYPVINSGRELYGYYSDFNNEGNAFTIASRGEYAGFTTFLESRFWAGGLCYPYRSKNENQAASKFIFYYLKVREREIMNTLVSRASIPAINKSDCDKIPIPLPPLAIQNRIVEILDTFTELERELERELSARKKQYEYYRNALLSLEFLQELSNRLAGGAKIRMCSLREVCEKVFAGGDLPKQYTKNKIPTEEFPYPIYSNGSNENSLYGYSNSYKVDSEAVTISARGTIGFHTIRKAKFTPIVRLITLIPQTSIISSKFLNYALHTTRIEHAGTEVGIPQLTIPMLEKIQIPLPPIEVQNEVVEILDRFDEIVSSITIGLPAEIQARKKQYEYYRDKLLSFEAKC